MEELLQFLGAIRALSPECIAYLDKVVTPRDIRKKDVLLRIGEINRHLYFIKSGLLYCYYYVDEKLVPDWFFGPKHTVVSIGSFYDQVPSKACIEALEDCELLYVTKVEFDYLCEKFHEFSLIANVLYPQYLKEFHGYTEIMRCHTAEEKYQLLRELMPELAQQVAGKYLAPWLGMDEATLSRCRSNGRKK